MLASVTHVTLVLGVNNIEISGNWHPYNSVLPRFSKGQGAI